MKNSVKLFLIIILLSAMAFACTLGTEPEIIVVTVEVPAQPEKPVQPQEPAQPEPVQTEVIQPEPTATLAPPPTEVPPTALPPTEVIPTALTFTADKNLSCAEGTDWKRHWWVTSVMEYDEVEITATNSNKDYIMATTVDGQECWILLEGGDLDGDINLLPVKEGPKIPTVQLYIRNRFGQGVKLIFYAAEDSALHKQGEEVKRTSFPTGQPKLLKLPSNIYWVNAYIGNANVWNGTLNLAVGHFQHVKGLKTGNTVVNIP